MAAPGEDNTITENCPCRGVTLERLVRPAVLMLLAGGPLNGYRLVGRLAGMPIFGGQKPNTAGVYRCLKLLEGEGSVRSAWEVTGRGPAQRLYTLTPAGRKCLAIWMETLEGYRQALGELLALGREVLARGAPDIGAHQSTNSCSCGCQNAPEPVERDLSN